MATVQRTTTLAVCPSCELPDSVVDHLLQMKTSTAWYCKHCGYRYSLDFPGDGTVSIAALKEQCIKTLVVLKLPPQAKPVYFVVDGMRFEGGMPDHDTQEERSRYYYEERSCPTNWLHPELVYHDGDADPHGLIKFVSVHDKSEFNLETTPSNDPEDALVKLIEADEEKS